MYRKLFAALFLSTVNCSVEEVPKPIRREEAPSRFCCLLTLFCQPSRYKAVEIDIDTKTDCNVSSGTNSKNTVDTRLASKANAHKLDFPDDKFNERMNDLNLDKSLKKNLLPKQDIDSSDDECATGTSCVISPRSNNIKQVPQHVMRPITALDLLQRRDQEIFVKKTQPARPRGQAFDLGVLV